MGERGQRPVQRPPLVPRHVRLTQHGHPIHDAPAVGIIRDAPHQPPRDPRRPHAQTGVLLEHGPSIARVRDRFRTDPGGARRPTMRMRPR